MSKCLKIYFLKQTMFTIINCLSTKYSKCGKRVIGVMKQIPEESQAYQTLIAVVYIKKRKD